MIINTKLNRKDSEIDTEVCNVIEVIELEKDEFRYFKNHLLEDFDFIAVRSEDMGTESGVRNCILVLGEGCNDGVIVCSEGFGYARYSNIVPKARQIIEAETLSPALKDYCKMMTDKVDKIISDALKNATDDNYSISIKSIETEYDIPAVNLHTLVNMLNERDEVDVADFDENDIFITPNRDYINTEGQSKDYDIYYDESCNDDMQILCAKHVLWLLDGTGEKANLHNTGIHNLDIIGKNLNGAILANVVMKNCSLKESELCFAKAEDAVFENVDFSGVTAEESEFINCKFVNCDFSSAFFTHSNLSGSDFQDCRFFRTSMQSCLINGTGFNTGDGDIPATLPNLDGSTQEADEWQSEITDEGMVQQ